MKILPDMDEIAPYRHSPANSGCGRDQTCTTWGPAMNETPTSFALDGRQTRERKPAHTLSGREADAIGRQRDEICRERSPVGWNQVPVRQNRDGSQTPARRRPNPGRMEAGREHRLCRHPARRVREGTRTPPVQSRTGSDVFRTSTGGLPSSGGMRIRSAKGRIDGAVSKACPGLAQGSPVVAERSAGSPDTCRSVPVAGGVAVPVPVRTLRQPDDDVPLRHRLPRGEPLLARQQAMGDAPSILRFHLTAGAHRLLLLNRHQLRRHAQPSQLLRIVPAVPCPTPTFTLPSRTSLKTTPLRSQRDGASVVPAASPTAGRAKAAPATVLSVLRNPRRVRPSGEHG